MGPGFQTGGVCALPRSSENGMYCQEASEFTGRKSWNQYCCLYIRKVAVHPWLTKSISPDRDGVFASSGCIYGPGHHGATSNLNLN